MMQASKCRHDHTKNLMAFQKEKKAVVTEGKNHVKQGNFVRYGNFNQTIKSESKLALLACQLSKLCAL